MSLEKFFHLKENNTTVKTEIMAGVTSFMHSLRTTRSLWHLEWV